MLRISAIIFNPIFLWKLNPKFLFEGALLSLYSARVSFADLFPPTGNIPSLEPVDRDPHEKRSHLVYEPCCQIEPLKVALLLFSAGECDRFANRVAAPHRFLSIGTQLNQFDPKFNSFPRGVWLLDSIRSQNSAAHFLLAAVPS
jgi:hypothetical protein